MGDLRDVGDREWGLVATTYEKSLESLATNEEMGERRVQMLFTIASAAGVAVGLVADAADESTALWTGAAVSLAVAFLGLLTVMRLARRNVATTNLINGLMRVRQQVAAEGSLLQRLFVYDPYEKPKSRKQDWLPTKGGLVDLAGSLTAIFAGAAVVLGGLALSYDAAVVSTVGVAAAVLAWLGQVRMVRGAYRKAGGAAGPVPATFRANAGIVVTNDRGEVLALERADVPGAWQLPQGGIEPGEEPRDAALRELTEETGLRATDVEIVGEVSDWLAYELPPEHRSAKTGRGQVQRWFHVRLRPGATPGRSSTEAGRLAWKPFDEVLAGAVDFRRPVYERVGREFELSGPSSTGG